MKNLQELLDNHSLSYVTTQIPKNIYTCNTTDNEIPVILSQDDAEVFIDKVNCAIYMPSEVTFDIIARDVAISVVQAKFYSSSRKENPMEKYIVQLRNYIVHVPMNLEIPIFEMKGASQPEDFLKIVEAHRNVFIAHAFAKQGMGITLTPDMVKRFYYTNEESINSLLCELPENLELSQFAKSAYTSKEVRAALKGYERVEDYENYLFEIKKKKKKEKEQHETKVKAF